MKNTRILLLALFAATACCAAGEDIMPLVPGDFGAGGQERAPLRRNNVRLTLPSLGRVPDARMRVVEALPEDGDGALRFREATYSAGQVGIPGYVPPEVLALSRMEAAQERPPERSRPGFTPISLPTVLGTEELMEFDPYSVQRTGDPFKDAPGAAEAFPMAATGAATGGGARNALLLENGNLRPPKTEDEGLTLRPSASSPSPSFAPSSPAAVVAAARLSGPQFGGQAAQAMDPPPLPELSVRTMTGGASRKMEEGTLPSAVPAPLALPAQTPMIVSEPEPAAGSAPGAPAGLRLPLPPMALTDGRMDMFVAPPPLVAGAGVPLPRIAVGPSLPFVRAEESAPRIAVAGAPSLPPGHAEEFVPMRGVSLLRVQPFSAAPQNAVN